MKSFLISDNKDTLVGLRLAGMNGIVAVEREEIIKELDKAIEDKDIGIIILTEGIFNKIKDRVLEIKLKESIPLIITIPSRYGMRDKDFITKYIRDSIGIKI
ncbi:V-type ATP synthase subunit F [Anaerosalibacter massiliensis]|uniref:V-type ATP synthase subunit F n=1 Tax=Anaerosalibacter massiliensis TaxID=1347392 RepID=UPI0005B2D870|nr:V-type ATP synthase subunit F [Anaerosalibacter massiliensis]